MEPYVARAFLNKLLNESEKEDLRRQEDKSGTYLQGFQICQKYHLKPEPLRDEEMARMTALYRVWQTKWEMEFDRLRALHPGDEASFNVTGDELLSDLRSWEWYAEKNYVEPMMPAGTKMGLVLTFVVGGLLGQALS